MDTSMIEATQALEYDDDYNEENDEDQDGNRTVGYLNVPCQKGFPGKQYPITEGDNVIGRGDHCNIYIPLKGLSREHACIEIKGENHFIYDKGSRNKTKRNNFFLSTQVRYELKDGDKLLFGDVNCTYKIGTEAEDGDETGSETGSESMFETAPSFSANGLTVLETPAPPRAVKGFTGNLIIPESDSEPEDDLTKTVTTLEADTQDTSAVNLMGAPTQAFVSESDVTTDDDFSPKKKSILTAATQAYDMDTASDDDSPSKRNLLMAATQAFVADSDESPSPKKSKKNISPLEPTLKYDMPEVIEATQGYDMEGDTEGENEEDDDEEERRKQLLCQATQAVKGAEDSDVETDNEKEEESRKLLLGQATQAFKGTEGSDDETDNEKEEESRKQLLCQATQAFKGAEGSDNETDDEKDDTSDMSKLLAQPTQAFFADKQKDKEDDKQSESSEEFVLEGDTDNENDDDEAARNMFAAPTLACDADNGENTNKSEVPDDQTVQVEDKTMAVCDEATQAVIDKTCNADATVPVCEVKTQPVVDKTDVHDDATVAVEDTTQAITDMETQAVTDASPTKNPYSDDTQALSGNSPNKKSGINEEDVGTQLIDNDATQVLPGTSNVDDSPAKQTVPSAVDHKNKSPHDITEMETQAVEGAATMAIQDDDTKPAADRQDSGSFDITAVSTLAPSDSVEYSADNTPENNVKGNITELETQVIDNATVKVNEDETMAVCDDTVPPISDTVPVDKGDQIDQTVPVTEDVKETIPISDTVPVSAAETVATETVLVTDDVKATVPVSETVPVSDITAAETVAIETVPVSDTVPVADPEIMDTVPVDNEIDTDKMSETSSFQEEEVKSSKKKKTGKADQSNVLNGKDKAPVNQTKEAGKTTKTSNRRGRGKKNNEDNDEIVIQDQNEAEGADKANISTARHGRRGKSAVNSNETSESKKPYQTKSERTVKRKTLLDEEDSEKPVVEDSADETSVKDDSKSEVGDKSNARTSRSRIKKKENEASEENQDKTSVESAVDESGDKNQSKTGRGRGSKKPAEPVNKTEQEPETQIYGASPKKGQAGSSVGLDEADTQVYGASPVKGKDCIEEAETQMYGVSPKKGSSSEEPTQTFGDEDATPSLSLPDDEGLMIPKPALVPLPSRSPYKSAMASPEKKSPSPKRVQFISQTDNSSTSTNTEQVQDSGTEHTGNRPRRGRAKEGKDDKKAAEKPGRKRKSVAKGDSKNDNESSTSDIQTKSANGEDDIVQSDAEKQDMDITEVATKRPSRGKTKLKDEEKSQGGNETTDSKPGRKTRSEPVETNNDSSEKKPTSRGRRSTQAVSLNADVKVNEKKSTKNGDKIQSETVDETDETSSEISEVSEIGTETLNSTRSKRSRTNEKLNEKPQKKRKSTAKETSNTEIVSDVDSQTSQTKSKSRRQTQNVALETISETTDQTRTSRSRRTTQPVVEENVTKSDNKQNNTGVAKDKQTETVVDNSGDKDDVDQNSRKSRRTKSGVSKEMESAGKGDLQGNEKAEGNNEDKEVKDENKRKGRKTKNTENETADKVDGQQSEKSEPIRGKRKATAETSVESKGVEDVKQNTRTSRRTTANVNKETESEKNEASVDSKNNEKLKDVKQNARTSRRTTCTVSKDAENEQNESIDSKTTEKSKDVKQTTRTNRRTTGTVNKDTESETSESVDNQVEETNETIKGKRKSRTKTETDTSVTSDSKTNKTGGKTKTNDNTEVTKGKAAVIKPVAGRRTGKRKGTDESSSDSTDLSQNDEGTPAKKQKIADVSTKTVMSTPKNTSKQPTNTETPKNKPVESTVTDSPTLRKTTVSGQKPKIMFTGVTDEQGEKVVKELGGELVSSVMECTHLVTDQIRRTVKFLCCLSRGVPIVSPQWLTSSKKCGFFSDTAPHLIRDDASEKKFKCSLQRSLSKAGEGPLLEGYKIHVTKSVKPPPEHMKDILKCAGAQYLTTMPKSSSPTTIIISCDEDRPVCDAAIKNNITVVNAEFILTGILRQEVDLNSYKLFADASQEPPSKKRKR